MAQRSAIEPQVQAYTAARREMYDLMNAIKIARREGRTVVAGLLEEELEDARYEAFIASENLRIACRMVRDGFARAA